MILKDLRKDLKKLANPKKAELLARFFKTGKGEYGEGDIFLGISVPNSRSIAHKYKDLSQEQIKELFQSKIHEERLIAILLLVHNFQKGDEEKKKEIYQFYLNHTQFINNWDLVDLSAPKIIGDFLLSRKKDILYKLAKSESLWERRIAIISTFQFIYYKHYEDTLKIAEILLYDKHDLIQKAVGWMLREVGKRCSQETEEKFLKKYYRQMPRTMLRYAIEKFPTKLRIDYLRRD